MDKALAKMYKRVRAAHVAMLVGHNAKISLNAARTILKFQEMEDAGLVRIIAESDDNVDLSWVGDGDPRMNEESKRRYIEQYCSEAWGVIGEYFDGENWEQADSIWGNMGYRDPCSPFENCYVADIMAATIEAYQNATYAACP